MKILCSGSSGFIGSFLIPKLRELGHDVYCFEEYFFKSIGDSPEKNHLELGDIQDAMRVRDIMRSVDPEVIIHLAAMTAVSHSYDNYYATIMTNAVGTVLMVESARIECSNLKQFIFPSSAEVYGVNRIPLKREIDPLIPNSPYALTKQFGEGYLRYLYLSQYKVPSTIVRPFNTYGRVGSHHFVVEKTIFQMVRNRSVSGKKGICELGTNEPWRDFLHIDDHINAYLCLLGNEKAIGQTFNLSTGVGITIGNLAKLIKKLTGFKGKVVWKTMPSRPLDIMHLIGDNTKLTGLGWKKPTPLEQGLELTIEKWRQKLNA